MEQIGSLLGVPEKIFDSPMQTVTDKCWMKIRIEDEALGEDNERTIVIGLFGEIVPKTV